MTKGFWKHARFMDAYILVLKITYRGSQYLKVKAEWWVRGAFVGIKQTLTIRNSDLKNWHRV